MTAMGVEGWTPESLPRTSQLKAFACIRFPLGPGSISASADRDDSDCKKCHQHCEIYHKIGMCIMPQEGIFVRSYQKVLSIRAMRSRSCREAKHHAEDCDFDGQRQEQRRTARRRERPAIAERLEAADIRPCGMALCRMNMTRLSPN